MNNRENHQIIELLNKNWMTHDGLWFYHCLQEFGIDKTNKMNKAAIASLAPIETKRLIKYLGLAQQPIETFDTFKRFFESAKELFIPNFMNVEISFPETNCLYWEFKPSGCFAYKGMVSAGVIDQYECGVIYRIECWIRSLGISFKTIPEISRCLMLENGSCSGNILLNL